MNRTRLIQRLEKPSNGMGNAFSFGGGFQNGGFSQEAMDLINPIFSFDYMGAAQFEFGALPKAFQKIGDYSQKGEAISGKLCFEKNSIYYLCKKNEESEVKEIISSLVKDPHSLRLKEPTNLQHALNGDEYYAQLKGWIELDNGFFFFIDEEMFKKTCDLFGVNYE